MLLSIDDARDWLSSRLEELVIGSIPLPLSVRSFNGGALKAPLSFLMDFSFFAISIIIISTDPIALYAKRSLTLYDDGMTGREMSGQRGSR